MRYKIISVILILLIRGKSYSQDIDYLSEFNKVLNSEYSVGYSKKRIESKSKRGNSINFLELGYYINSNNIILNKDNSYVVIQNIISSSLKNESQYKWIVTSVSESHSNYSEKGKEFMLYEGYLFRYIAEFQYLYPNRFLSDPDFTKNNFFKWYDRSIEKHRDASSLYALRLHIGSHWATVAAYLTKLDSTNTKIYKSFIDEYDKQLKKSLKIVKVNGNECYIWNSTYKENFTNNLKNRKKQTIIQDVSHGSHIVQYVIDSYKLGSSSWSKKDLERFANTLKYIIWKDKSKPSDNVDGTIGAESTGSGWKQSDGWMKLMNVLNDEELYEIYDNFYNENINKINMNYPYIQFLANMAVYQQNNK
ncbi:hypothetical protein [Avrilella dinanensis]|uniref:hypothetical protein n=1 Tax=Avrilella dinanensis TaxID=2008672 RepID=UPI00240985ED|nr:hypothetical protein [Avrilella dinanensis]